MTPETAVLTGVLVLAAAIWIGGYVAIAVVARVSARTLSPPARIAFLRDLGRAYGLIGTSALVLALAVGAGLLHAHAWDALVTGAVAVAAALVGSVVVGMTQAHRIGRLRRQALDAAGDHRLVNSVRRAARAAGLLRALIGGLSLALLGLGIALAASSG
jgi:uncharacterized membrane protein